jgi:hypothetical protein
MIEWQRDTTFAGEEDKMADMHEPKPGTQEEALHALRCAGGTRGGHALPEIKRRDPLR